ncbi:conserved hypothetical protein [Methanococcus vannielii SB]|uniref:Glycosyltransferase RgtA/B/C/D-like domain-containing protein n=1 Tax=Methanococcus vannielii (strain ATCC 35089 / DSM 1224 / JCM 13029 / OCM 148 / SB) TaxID=406327 RepID=A6UNN8_METVS|nr:hypothetical protein [Methanococcus vannielii]ABR54110.1 conserved hypothetical protein [Methanococcus vannielii SB]
MKNKFIKSFLIISFISLIFACIFAYENPASGYESSIYSSTPILVWLFLCLAASIGYLVSLYSLKNKKHIGIFFGIFSLILCRVIFLTVPPIRGYVSWVGDHMAHIGNIKDIISFGTFGTLDYPIVHIILSAVSLICNLDVTPLSMYSTPFFTLLFVLSIYMLTKITLGNKYAYISLIAVVLFLPSRYNIYLMPNGWALFTLPIFFYAIFKYLDSKNHSWTLISILFLIIYPFFHPQVALYVILTLWLILSLKIFEKIIQIREVNNKIFLNSKGILINISIISLIFSAWLLKSKRFYPNFRILFKSFSGKATSSASIDSKLEKFSKVGMEGFSIITYIIKAMGSELIFVLMSFCSLLSFIKYYKNYSNKCGILTIFTITFLAFFLYVAVNLNIIPGLKSIGADRFIAYVSIFTPILSSIFIFSILKINKPIKNLGILIISIILISSSILGGLNMYPSNYTVLPSPQATLMNFYGYSWLFNNNHDEIEILSIMSVPSRVKDAILGISKVKNTPSRISLPDHFNYYEGVSLRDSVRKDSYVFISEIDRVTYTGIWENVGRFNNMDFEKTYSDKTINLIYSSKEDNIWLVQN